VANASVGTAKRQDALGAVVDMKTVAMTKAPSPTLFDAVRSDQAGRPLKRQDGEEETSEGSL